MKLILNNSEGIEFSCKEDLAKAIPVGIHGKPLNYGQGEGQVEIDDTVWGFYVNSEGSYYMAFEEGVVEWTKIVNLVHAITGALTQQFGKKITVSAEGPFTNDPNA
ncbi:hypothetical protein [Teredinibacter waterburyi]|uniref:hypothetical protein n=1 Tax=Teredinibacter waterburyi TaxID=1500538 RepID=UPI00165FB798|nr:hypothetical protein [Teredinibacter waterburyi]